MKRWGLPLILLMVIGCVGEVVAMVIGDREWCYALDETVQSVLLVAAFLMIRDLNKAVARLDTKERAESGEWRARRNH